MSKAPVVLDVPGSFFAPTHKYSSSAAMVLDDSAACDDSTGDVESPTGHVMIFRELDVAQAYSIVNEYIESEIGASKCNPPTWWEARQMIDILHGGRNWFVHTDSQGFVMAHCEISDQEAQKTWEAIESEYSEWAGDDDETDN